jgi:hypothetical protein
LITGIYEKPIILALERYFDSKGFSTYVNAHLNIAWGTVISDVDLLLIRKKEVIAIEVKSKKDVFRKAFFQLEKIASFIDKGFIATDDENTANKFRRTDSQMGILYVNLKSNDIVIKKSAKTYEINPSSTAISCLKRCCLEEFAKELRIPPYQPKEYLALDIQRTTRPRMLKARLKELVIANGCTHR